MNVRSLLWLLPLNVRVKRREVPLVGSFKKLFGAAQLIATLWPRMIGFGRNAGTDAEASCTLARMIGDWYLRKIEKQPNEVQTI